MTERNMPQDGASDDMGGNPLREGILGDYDNRSKRDESFASVRETPYAPLWYSSAELKPDPDVPADLVDVIPEEDLPDKRKDRKLDNIESSIQKEAFFRSLMSWGGAALGGALGGPGGALLGRTAGGLVGNALGGKMDSAISGGGGGQQAQQQVAPAVEDPSFYSAVAAGPSETFAPGMNKIPDANDSQDGDTKQHDDGDRSKGEQVGDGVNDGGGTDQGNNDFGGFSEENIGRLLTMLPLLLHHGETGTGGEDPLVQALDQMLEGEVPGYKDTHTDPKAHEQIVMLFKHKPDKGDSMATDDNETQPDGHTTESIHTALQQPGLMNNPAQTTMRPNDAMGGNHCQMCGGTIGPTNPSCPQCGAPNAHAQGGLGQIGIPGVTASPDWSQIPFGPTPWLDSAYKEWQEAHPHQPSYIEFPDIPPDMSIKDWNANGRPIHCPNCGNPTVDKESRTCTNCGEYKHFAKRVVADGQGPQSDDQKALMAQALQEQDRGDEIPQMILNPAQYAREFAQLIGKEIPPEIEGGQPPAPPVAQPPAPGQGDMSGAGPMAAPGPQMAMARAIQRHAGDHIQQHGDNFDNSLDVPAADQVAQDDPEQEQDPSHHWADENGNPLKVGQEYEMYSANYDIPDLIRVEAVKPDSIEFTLTGEYGLDHRTEVTWQEAQMEGYSFQDAQSAHGDELGGADPYNTNEDNMDDQNRTAPGESSDLSTPHQMAYASIDAPTQEEVDDQSVSERNWLMKDAGAKFTPYEQREFIEEAGVARNADKLDLRGTHYEASRVVEVDPSHFLFGW